MQLDKDWLKEIFLCTEGICIIDDNTKELVFVNESLTKTHGEDYQGKKCFSYLFNKNNPCEVCANACEYVKFNKNKDFYSWEQYNKQTGEWYKIKNRFCERDRQRFRICNLNQIEDVMDLNHETVSLLAENQHMRLLLEKEANYDKMTGLMNRNKYNADISFINSLNAPVGVLYFDLNNLKEVNDKYKHNAGDTLLKSLASAIGFACTNSHIFAYRIGGDEFVVLYTGCTCKELETLAAKIGSCIENENRSKSIKCSFSIGKAFSEKCVDIEALVSAADKMMYEAKQVYRQGHSR